ncbi:MAG TPA: transposase [Mycobacterium sp.]|nr:transposase [Mycobacterium sp.]
MTRHRLSRSGDRAAKNALYRIALVRMSADPQTRDYVERQIGRVAPRRFCGYSNEPSPAKYSDCCGCRLRSASSARLRRCSALVGRHFYANR